MIPPVPEPLLFVLRHLWLIIVLGAPLRAVLFLRASPVPGTGPTARRSWIARETMGLAAIALALYALQLLSGAPHPFFPLWPDPERSAAIALVIAAWTGTLYAMCLGGGDRLAAEAFGFPAARARLLAVGAVASGVLALGIAFVAAPAVSGELERLIGPVRAAR